MSSGTSLPPSIGVKCSRSSIPPPHMYRIIKYPNLMCGEEVRTRAQAQEGRRGMGIVTCLLLFKSDTTAANDRCQRQAPYFRWGMCVDDNGLVLPRFPPSFLLHRHRHRHRLGQFVCNSRNENKKKRSKTRSGLRAASQSDQTRPDHGSGHTPKSNYLKFLKISFGVGVVGSGTEWRVRPHVRRSVETTTTFTTADLCLGDASDVSSPSFMHR